MVKVRLPTVRVALYGPVSSGKTSFISALLGKSYVGTHTFRAEEHEFLRTLYKVVRGKKIPIETYKFILVDLPGAPDLISERITGLKRIVGLLLFYNATEPSSAEQLKNMVEKELLRLNILQNLIGIILVGTVKGKNPDCKAVSIAHEILTELNPKIYSLWGYSIPHIILDIENKDDATLLCEIIEEILTTLKVPSKIESLLASKYCGLEEPPTTIKKPVSAQPITPQKESTLPPLPELPSIPQSAPQTKAVTEVKLAEKKIELKPIFMPKDSMEIKEQLKALLDQVPGAEQAILIEEEEDDVYEIESYPDIDLLASEDLLTEIVLTTRKIRDLCRESGILSSNALVVYGINGTLIIVNKPKALLYVRIRGLPEKDLLEKIMKADFLSKIASS